MNTFKIIVAIYVVYISCVLCAQQGKYVRKSISSLETVWFKSGSIRDMDEFNEFIGTYIEVDRFDYNILPSSLLNEFHRNANSIVNVSADALSDVLEKTVINKIVEILNEPEVMQKRGIALKDESAFHSFAATKAKSLGLTTEELKTLMNSAYIYLPFISSVKKDSEGWVTVKGGIIWWQMMMASDGTTSIKKILSATTKANSPDGETDAVLSFCKNLGVETKEIEAFKLTAQIVEVDGRNYSFPLGFKEGLHLDDAFHIVEIKEDEVGNEVVDRIGFTRVTKTGNNVENPNDYTVATQLFGSRASEGSIMMEHPRLGQDLTINYEERNGMRINTQIPIFSNILDQDPEYYNLFSQEDGITSAVGASVGLFYNLAPIWGISQTFLGAEMGLLFPKAEINSDFTDFYGGILFSKIGYTKKFWTRRHNLVVGLQLLGFDFLFLGADYKTTNENDGYWYYDDKIHYSLMMFTLTSGASVDYEILMSSNLSINIGANYLHSYPPLYAELSTKRQKSNGGTTNDDKTEIDYKDKLKDSNFSTGGLGITFGINYSLRSSWLEMFGGDRDKLKKY